MNLTITKHAAERMQERGILQKDILDIFNDEYALVQVVDDELMMVTGTASDEKLWTLVVNFNIGKLVTVRRANRKEIKWYGEQ